MYITFIFQMYIKNTRTVHTIKIQKKKANLNFRELNSNSLKTGVGKCAAVN